MLCRCLRYKMNMHIHQSRKNDGRAEGDNTKKQDAAVEILHQVRDGRLDKVI